MTPARLFATAHVAVVLAVLARAALSAMFTQLVVLAFVTIATASATEAASHTGKALGRVPSPPQSDLI